MGKYIAYKLFNAQNYAYICSPYIDQYYAEAILKLARRGVNVKVISTDKQAGGFYLGDYFEQQAGSIGNNFDYLIFEKDYNNFIHAKMYVIDNKYAVDGSCNLTRAGLWNNVEHVNVYDFADEVQAIKESFEKIWRFNDGGGLESSATKNERADRKSIYGQRRNYHNQTYRRRYYYEDEEEDEEIEEDEAEEGRNNDRYRENNNRGTNYGKRSRYYKKTDNEDDIFGFDSDDEDEEDDSDDDFF